MDDFSLYIRKQIINLVKRPENTILLKSNLHLSNYSVAKSNTKGNPHSQTFWQQYRRQKISQSSSNLRQKCQQGGKSFKKSINKSNPLLLKRMLMQEMVANRQPVKEDNYVKRNILLNLQDKQSGRQSKRSKRSTIYERVVRPHPLTRQVSGVSDNYLQAKRSFSKHYATAAVKIQLQRT